jgi:hypothetical protein
MAGRTSPESGSGESGPAFPHVHAEIKTWTRGGPRTITKTMRNTAPAAASHRPPWQPRNGDAMSVYSVIEIIGTSSTS